MRLSVSAAAPWPAPDRLDEAWRACLDDLLVALPDPGAGPGPAHWRLSGSHLHPGADYRYDDPELTVGTLELRVRGELGARTVRADYLDHPSALLPPGQEPRAAHLELDGLDRPRLLTSTGAMRELTWSLRADTALRSVAGTATLPWAQAEIGLVAHDGVVTLDLEVAGRGLWRPVLAGPLLASRTQVEQGARETVETLAAWLRRAATHGRFVPTTEELLAQVDDEHEQVRTLLRTAQDVVEQARWWDRTDTAWRAAVAAGPALPDTPAAGAAVSVRDLGDDVARAVGTGRWARRRRIDRAVDASRARCLIVVVAVAAGSRDLGAATSFRLTDEDLDTTRLASPWGEVLRALGDGAATPPA